MISFGMLRATLTWLWKMRLFRVSVLGSYGAFSNDILRIARAVAEARSVSRLFVRLTRRASPGLDTDLSGLGLSFLYPGDGRFSWSTIRANSSEFSHR